MAIIKGVDAGGEGVVGSMEGFEQVEDDETVAAHKVADANVISISRVADAKAEAQAEYRRTIPDIVKRAKLIHSHATVDFPEMKAIGNSGNAIVLNTDLNILTAFSVLFGDTGPYYDTFRGFTIGWDGRIIDENYSMRPLLAALQAMKISSPDYGKVEKLFKRFARERQVNSLIERINRRIEPWDGVERLEMSFIKLFKCFDTELTREFSKYFWLSVYCRAMHPGTNAPIIMTLFGGQFAGKSYISKLICEEMMDNPQADAVSLSLDSDFNGFLRAITGQSFIANVAEMAGYGKGDLNKIKNLTSRSSDVMDHKFERSVNQPRQWVMTMDGNDYRGLQRDETGNRRFYPLFLGQLPYDSRNQVAWDVNFTADFSTFREDFWMYLAEARAWVETHGVNAYQNLVNTVTAKVKDFSANEMKNDRGTVRDDDLEAALPDALSIVEVMFVKQNSTGAAGGAGRPAKYLGAIVKANNLRVAIASVTGNRSSRLIDSHLKTKMDALGFEHIFSRGYAAYWLPEIDNEEQWLKRFADSDAYAKGDEDSDATFTALPGRSSTKNGGRRSKSGDSGNDDEGF
jgi:hypothetical protein